MRFFSVIADLYMKQSSGSNLPVSESETCSTMNSMAGDRWKPMAERPNPINQALNQSPLSSWLAPRPGPLSGSVRWLAVSWSATALRPSMQKGIRRQELIAEPLAPPWVTAPGEITVSQLLFHSETSSECISLAPSATELLA